MAIKEIVVTAEGLEKLKQELEELKTVKRPEVGERLKTARAFGDLSENSEYDEAKNEQAIVEGRIAGLEEQLKHVRILDEAEMNSNVIHVGSQVTIQQKGQKKTVEYRIAGATEADPLKGIISDECPIGRTLLGHTVGDEVEVTIPTGTVVYVVKKIAK